MGCFKARDLEERQRPQFLRVSFSASKVTSRPNYSGSLSEACLAQRDYLADPASSSSSCLPSEVWPRFLTAPAQRIRRCSALTLDLHVRPELHFVPHLYHRIAPIRP